MSTIPKPEVILIATMSNGLQIWKLPNKEVGGFIYYSEENGAPLPALVEALISIECLEIILNDMKKTQGQLATEGREELENQITQLKGMAIIKNARIDYDKEQITALQSKCTEKEKECEELKNQLDIIKLENSFADEAIEELKAENERLKGLIENAWLHGFNNDTDVTMWETFKTENNL